MESLYWTHKKNQDYMSKQNTKQKEVEDKLSDDYDMAYELYNQLEEDDVNE